MRKKLLAVLYIHIYIERERERERDVQPSIKLIKYPTPTGNFDKK